MSWPSVADGQFDGRQWSAALARIAQALDGPARASPQARQRVYALVEQVMDALGSMAPPAAMSPTLAAGETAERAPSPIETVPYLCARGGAPLHPGESVSMTVAVRNEGTTTSAELGLFATDLVAGTDRRIAGVQVTISPTRLQLEAGGSADVMVRLDVAPETRPGRYEGLLVARGNERLRAILSVNVAD